MSDGTDVNKNQCDLRAILQQEFVERCRKNQSYSLRAYAKSLGIEASPLSAILRGKRPIGSKTKKRLGLALGLSAEKLSELSDNKINSNIKMQQITLDSYALIADWYHYAILELIRVRSFKADIQYVSKTLGISATEAHIAVERLVRMGLLEINEKGQWLDTTENGFATNIQMDVTTAAARKLQLQILEKAADALKEVAIELRDHTSMTMAINPEDLPAAKEKIKKFRRELCVFLERNKKPTQVYQLGIALYPVTKGNN